MARVAVAYVEVRPDLTGFSTALRTKLKALKPTAKVKIDPDLTGFKGELRTKLKGLKLGDMSAGDVKVGLKEPTVAAAKAAAAKVKKAVVAEQKDLEDKLTDEATKGAKQRRKRGLLDATDTTKDQLRALVKQARAESSISKQKEKEYVALWNDLLNEREAAFEKEFKALLKAEAKEKKAARDKLTEDEKANRKRQRLHKQYWDTVHAADKRAFAEQEKNLSDAEKERARKELPLQRVLARQAAEAYARNYGDFFAKNMRKISQDEADDLEREMTRQHGAMGGQAARAFVRDFNNEYDRQQRSTTNDRRKTEREEEMRRRPTSRLLARFAAEDFAKEYLRRWRGSFRRVSADQTREFRRDMVDRFGSIGGAVADAALRDMDSAGGRAGRRFGQSFADQARLGINLRLGQMAPILGGLAASAAPLADVLSSMAAGLLALSVAAGQAAAGLGGGVLVGIGAVGQAAGASVISVQGFSDALKELNDIQTKTAAGLEVTEADINNFAQAMGMLSPQAQGVVQALGRVNGQLATVRSSLQEKMFDGLAGPVRLLADTYLPVLDAQLGRTANTLNQVGLSIARYALKASTVKTVNEIMSVNGRIIESLGRAVVPLLDVVLRLWRAFEPLGITLAQYVKTWADAINQTTAASDKTGRLARMVERLSTMMLQMFRIGENVFAALHSTMSALLGPGGTLLQMVENLTARWRAWASSVEGQTAIENWARDAIPVLSAVGRLIGDVVHMFDTLARSGMGELFVDQLRSILPPLEALLMQLSQSNAAGAFAEGLGEVMTALVDINAGGLLADAVHLIGDLLSALASFVDQHPALMSAIGGIILAMTTLAAIRFAATITGLLSLVGLTTRLAGFAVEITNVVRAMRGLQAIESTAALGNVLRTAFASAGTAMVGFRAQLAATRLEMAMATTASQALTLSLRAAWLTMLSNPIGWVLIGLGALATAIWAISAASSDATEKANTMNAALAKVGATGLAAQVDQNVAALKRQADMHKYGTLTVNEFGLAVRDFSKQQAFVAEAKQITAAANDMAQTYGRNAQVIIENLRGMGLQATTSSGEVLVAMQNIIAANNGVPLSAEQMQIALAQIYGLTAKDYGAMADAMTTVHNQIIAGYADISDAALKSAEDQILALQAALKATGKSATLEFEINERRLKELANYRKNKPKDLAPSSKDIADAYDKAIRGSGGGAGAAKKAGAQTAAGWITSFTAQIAELDPEYLTGKSARWTSIGSNIATYLAKGMTSGSKNIAKVSAYLSKHFGKTFIANIQKEIQKYRDALTVYDPITGKKQGKEFWEDRLQEIVDFKQRAYDALMEGANLVNYFGFIPTPGEVKQRLDDLIKQQTDFTTKLAKLQEKGLSKELAAAWLEAGYDQAGNLVEGLQDATPDQIKAINEQYNTLSRNAKTVSDQQATKYYGIGQSAVESVIKGIDAKTAAALAKITSLMNQALAAAKKDLNWTKLGEDAVAAYTNGFSTGITGAKGSISSLFDKLYATPKTKAKSGGVQLGKFTMEGYAQGITDNRTAVRRALDEVINGTIKGARLILKAGSPSRVYAGIGHDTMSGYALGVNRSASQAIGSVKRAMEGVRNVGTPQLGSPRFAGLTGKGGPQQLQPITDVKVFVGDREITDIVRTEVSTYDSTRARALLAGRRGG